MGLAFEKDFSGDMFAGALVGEASAAKRKVEITWTGHGIPHVVSSDFAGLGYGYGYAAATLDVCGLADAFATFSGTRSPVFGGDAEDVVRILGRRPIANVANDATRRLLNERQAQGADAAPPSARARALTRGFAAGFNRYVRETPRGARSCRQRAGIPASSIR